MSSNNNKRATMPRGVIYHKSFLKDWEKLNKSGRYDMNALKQVILLLIANDAPLPAEYVDHELKGEFKGFRECHIGGDFLLVYYLDHKRNVVEFARTGTHSELFK
ncbi:addiction module toxin RelE [Haemophilus paracuniculus]|uniref:Addiction module toxin RelE n=1 Tax=Haemophilus paracuniculus TaxID=734 RepID=A0A1T0AS74_9PAST|nr:type II toxin-antitoxin system mRNA interferase toxin, RelE/StbE family [Haemophilus paracuniculus]OOR98989.1 addiction module toxin RelE [Haemophilus paracuniculus]